MKLSCKHCVFWAFRQFLKDPCNVKEMFPYHYSNNEEEGNERIYFCDETSLYITENFIPAVGDKCDSHFKRSFEGLMHTIINEEKEE